MDARLTAAGLVVGSVDAWWVLVVPHALNAATPATISTAAAIRVLPMTVLLARCGYVRRDSPSTRRRARPGSGRPENVDVAWATPAPYNTGPYPVDRPMWTGRADEGQWAAAATN